MSQSAEEAEYEDVEPDADPAMHSASMLQTPSADIIIALPDGITAPQACHMLSSRIPNNEFGLPVYFYRTDLLAPYIGRLTQEALDASAVGLFYHDGYPTLDNGQAFWSQLPHEPYEAYNMFMRYIDQAESYGIRQLDLLAGETHTDLEDIRPLYQAYYWSARARAHDLFITAAEAKKREFRTRKMENNHFTQMDALFKRLMDRFEDPAWIDELTAKEAIEAMETLVKLQRMSVGLTGQHASSTQGGIPAGASAEYVMRKITKDAAAAMSGGSGNALQSKMRELLEGDSGAVLQEAILRVTHIQAAS